MSSVSAPHPVRLLAVSGSARTGSFNRQLLALAVRKAQAQGAETTIVDLRALGLPLYDADWHAANGFPAAALAWRELMASHDGLLLATPEYNAFPTPLLINSFDWLSLVPADAGLPSGSGATGGKPVGLMAASPGAFGGIRALPLVRTYLSTNFAMVVVPEQVAVPHADQQFNEDGGLLKVELDQALSRVVAAVIRQACWRRAG